MSRDGWRDLRILSVQQHQHAKCALLCCSLSFFLSSAYFVAYSRALNILYKHVRKENIQQVCAVVGLAITQNRREIARPGSFIYFSLVFRKEAVKHLSGPVRWFSTAVLRASVKSGISRLCKKRVNIEKESFSESLAQACTCASRSLSFYAPPKPKPSSPIATQTQAQGFGGSGMWLLLYVHVLVCGTFKILILIIHLLMRARRRPLFERASALCCVCGPPAAPCGLLCGVNRS